MLVQGQIITTMVGNGRYGYSGDGGAATAAGLYEPTGVAVDTAGNLYIADQFNNRVRKMDRSGIITTIAGTSISGYNGDGIAATDAELNTPTDVAVDNFGNIYIVDEVNERIRKVNSAGIISTVAGNGYGSPGPGGFSGDGGLAIDAELYAPFGIAVDVRGNLFIADEGNNRIRKVNTSGIISTIAGNGYGAAWSGSYSGDGGPATAAELFDPGGVAVDGSGNIYIADVANRRIRKVDTDGIITTFAGTGISGYSGDGGMATLAELVTPTGITVDKKGNLYIADQNCNRVRKVNSSGIITTLAGVGEGLPYTDGYSGDGGPAIEAKLASPVNVVADGYGNIYIADANNNRIRYVLQFIPPISGKDSICIGATDTFSDELRGGVWSSSDTNIVSIGSSTGIISGSNTGPAILTYDLSDISVTYTLTVYSCKSEDANSLFPNPVNSELNLTSSNLISTVSIINLLGQTVFSQQYNGPQVKVDVADLPTGMYLVKINGSEVKKFVKE